MQRPVQLLIALALVASLAACGSAGEVKKPLPPATVVKTEVVPVDRYIYVPIDKRLTRRAPIAEGPLAQCPIVAAERRAALVEANKQFAEIETVQGKPAKGKP